MLRIDPIVKELLRVGAGPVLAHNLRASLICRRLRRYRLQASALASLATGGRHAILTRNGVTFDDR